MYLGALGTIVAPVCVFTMIVLVVWFGTRTARTAIQEQAELRKKLIDKFGSAQELSTFLESKGGQQLLGDLGNTRVVWWERRLRVGVILTTLGLALLGLTIAHRMDVVPGVIALALGIAFLIVAAISHKFAVKAGGNGDSHGQPSERI